MEEAAVLEEIGLEKFWHHDNFDMYDVNRKRYMQENKTAIMTVLFITIFEVECHFELRKSLVVQRRQQCPELFIQNNILHFNFTPDPKYKL